MSGYVYTIDDPATAGIDPEEFAAIEAEKAAIQREREEAEKKRLAAFRRHDSYCGLSPRGKNNAYGPIDDPRDRALAERLERARKEKEEAEAAALRTAGDWVKPREVKERRGRSGKTGMEPEGGPKVETESEVGPEPEAEPEVDVGNEATRKSLVERYMERTAGGAPRPDPSTDPPKVGRVAGDIVSCPTCNEPYKNPAYRRCYKCSPPRRSPGLGLVAKEDAQRTSAGAADGVPAASTPPGQRATPATTASSPLGRPSSPPVSAPSPPPPPSVPARRGPPREATVPDVICGPEAVLKSLDAMRAAVEALAALDNDSRKWVIDQYINVGISWGE